MRPHASEERLRLFVQFLQFGVVGVIGFVIDTATVYALWKFVGLYVAGFAGFFTAASGTWFCNRLWTFRHLPGRDAWHVQWARFLAANFTGFLINRGVYVLLITFVDFAARVPAVAVGAGALAGMLLNFNLSRKVVFR
jgi:putative flippase GtrA